jgi:TolB-like protein
MSRAIPDASGAAMVEQDNVAVSSPDSQAETPEQREKKLRKKKDKIRSAWISFVGRIVAQIMGAVATIALGLMLVQKYQFAGPNTEPSSSVEPSAAKATPVRLASPGEPSLAVLPLETFSVDSEESFADGMTEALIADLSHLDGVRVISRTSSSVYKKQRRSLPEIASELGVDFIVEGSVIKSEGRVRITAQLIDAKSDEHLWAGSYDRPLREVLSIQAKVANAIAREVKNAIATTPHGTRAVVSRRTPDLQPIAFERQ